MKALSIPQLELQAALLVSRLNQGILRAFSIKVIRTILWTDSSTVLQWLYFVDKLTTFVANRGCEV